MAGAPEIAVVIPTLGRPALLRRVLDRLARQTAGDGIEVLIVMDAGERQAADVELIVAGSALPARALSAPRPGASAARNAGWRAAAAPLVLFLDDDILPSAALVAEHLDWHHRWPDERVGVLGDVRWADELRVTPFMRWLENGIQFDYPNIEGTDAGWARFYTANVSVKRSLIERSGGFDEVALPFGYEDLDLALRMHELGFELRYNRAATAEHLHPMDLDFWRRRVARIAVAERTFVRMHPGFRPYFHELFSTAAAEPRARGWGERLARFVPREVPLVGPKVWGSADAVYSQALAEPFLSAWEAAGDNVAHVPAGPGGQVPE